MQANIQRIAVCYIVRSIATWKPEGEFAFWIGSGEQHGKDSIENEVLTMLFTWRGLAENIACLLRGSATEIEIGLKQDPEALLEAITTGLEREEGVICSKKHKSRVKKTNGSICIHGYYENRIGAIHRKGGLGKSLLIGAFAKEIMRHYDRFCAESGLKVADFWVVSECDAQVQWPGKILTWKEIAESASKKSHFDFSANELLYFIRENILDLYCELCQIVDISAVTIAYKQGLLRIFPKENLYDNKCSPWLNDYFMDGMK